VRRLAAEAHGLLGPAPQGREELRFVARVPLPVPIRLDGGQFLQFGGTISQLTGDEHVSIEDGDEYVVTFELEAPSAEQALGEARAAVGAGLHRLGFADLEFSAASVEEMK
jgi:hypothetical protein